MHDEPSNPVNPYEAPREGSPPAEAPLSREDALHALRRPAQLLFWTSVASIPVGMTMIGFMIMTGNRAMLPEGLIEMVLLAVLLFTLFVVKPACIIYSTRRFLQGTVFPWVWIAIGIGLVPFGSYCAMLELVFAFWLMHLMLKPRIKAVLTNRLPNA